MPNPSDKSDLAVWQRALGGSDMPSGDNSRVSVDGIRKISIFFYVRLQTLGFVEGQHFDYM